MENEGVSIKRRKTFLILLYVSILFIAVAIWITTTITRTPADEANLQNYNKSSLNLNSKLKSVTQKKLYEIISLAYGIEKGNEPVGHIRNETIKSSEQSDGTKIYKFTVDVDSYKLTYSAEVWETKNEKDYQAFFYCVSPEESKYPNNFCIGYNGQSTIDVTIANSLPIVARETKNHYFYDVKQTYKEKSIQPVLQVFVNSCGNKEMIEEVRQDFKDWIRAKGYNPEIFPIDIPEINCRQE